MRAILLRLLFVAPVLGGSFVDFAVAREPGTEDGEAAKQVRAALEAELSGRPDMRDSLLTSVRLTSPDYSPARWHSGHVRDGKTWAAVEAIQRQAAADRRLDSYVVARGRTGDKPEEQLALARWCRSKRLYAQERTHLMQVLKQQPRNAQALNRLGVAWVGGELLTAKEHAEHKRLEVQATGELRRWSARLKQWGDWIEGNNEPRRAEGLEQLRGIDNPAAVPALEKLIAGRSEELAREAVEVLGKMPQQPATDALTRLAVLSKWSYVRSTAIDKLRSRSWYSLMPQLLSGMQMPVEAKYAFEIRPGMASLVYSFFREDQHARYRIVRGKTVHRWALRIMAAKIVPFGNPRVDSAQIAAQTRDTQRRLLALNERINRRNQRIGYVLAWVTGEDYTANPQSWWEWWNRWNEVYSPGEKPLRQSELHDVREMRVALASCFPAGTPVWTERGLTTIEQIQVGDRVLSQDQQTGELAFQSVIGTTIRPETPLLEISYGSETIAATRGHPFWVSGKGWRMARRLAVGDLLHGVHGSLRIESLRDAEPARAYNLIVDRFNTYFVGRRGLLVHDNILRQPTLCVLPGLRKSELPDEPKPAVKEAAP